MVGILTTIAPTVLTLVISGRQTQQQRWHYVKRMCNRLQQLITTSNTLGLTKLPRPKSMLSIINVFCCQFFRKNFNFSNEEDTLICIKKTGSLTKRCTNFLLKSDNKTIITKNLTSCKRVGISRKCHSFHPRLGKCLSMKLGYYHIFIPVYQLPILLILFAFHGIHKKHCMAAHSPIMGLC